MTRFAKRKGAVVFKKSASLAGCVGANRKAKDRFVVRHSFFTNSKEDKHMDKTLSAAAPPARTH